LLIFLGQLFVRVDDGHVILVNRLNLRLFVLREVLEAEIVNWVGEQEDLVALLRTSLNISPTTCLFEDWGLEDGLLGVFWQVEDGVLIGFHPGYVLVKQNEGLRIVD